ISDRLAIGTRAGAESARAIVGDVVTAIGDRRLAAVTAAPAAGQNRVRDRRRVAVADSAAAGAGCAVAREGAVDDVQPAPRAIRAGTAIAMSHADSATRGEVGAVARKSAVGDVHHAAIITDGAAAEDRTRVEPNNGTVAGERAVGDRQCATRVQKPNGAAPTAVGPVVEEAAVADTRRPLVARAQKDCTAAA